MSKFIIFAHPRSGSSSLARVLGTSKGVKMGFEPFHPDFSKWNKEEKNYSKLVTNTASLKDVINEIFDKYTAIKVLSYQLAKNFYSIMLKNKEYKILFLTRKKLFEAALSNLIAEQTKEWHKLNNLEVYNNLKPIPIPKIKNWMKYVGDTNDYYFRLLEKYRKNDYLPLFYEELFSDNLEDNVRIIQKICDYLKIPLPPRNEIKKYMSPTESKINVNDLYKRLPNYPEICEYFVK